jgi:ribosome-binding protein aMBF1 (putative translation factor)
MDKHFETLDKKNLKLRNQQQMNTLDHQDWTTVTLKTKKTIKQENKQTTKKLSQAQQRDNKLLKKAENDELKHDKVPQDLRTKIIQTRASLKWKQKDLAQKCNFPVTVINEIESGKAIYNPQHINKIKRILKL